MNAKEAAAELAAPPPPEESSVAGRPQLQPELHQEPVDVKRPDAGDATFWSVTTIIGCLEKPALLYWSAEETAKAAVKIHKTLGKRLKEDGEPETIKWLRDARFRAGKDHLSNMDLGTVNHECFEQYALTGTRPTRTEVGDLIRAKGLTAQKAVNAEGAIVWRTLDRFAEFLDDFQPEYLATEVTVYSPEYGWAGTADGFAIVGGVPLIIDYKTSRESYDKKGEPKGPYPEAALQVAAYRHAEIAAVWRARRYEHYRRRYYLLSQQERELAVPPPVVDGGIIIHLSPDRYGVYPVRCDAEIYERFLFVQEAARWQFEMAKDVLGTPMVPPPPKEQ